MKKLFFIFIPLFVFGQQSKICNISESEIASKSKIITGLDAKELKKTKLGYVYETADLTLLYVKVNDAYNLSKIKGNNDAVKSAWLAFFGNTVENPTIKRNGSDIRLQKYQDQFYIESYSCEN